MNNITPQLWAEALTGACRRFHRRFWPIALLAGMVGLVAACDSSSDRSGNEAGSSAARSGAPQGNAGRPGGGRPGGGRSDPLVVASEVNMKLINNRLKAVGNGTAASSVSVVPLSGGIVTEILVSPGQQVEANTTLATLDNEEQQIAYNRAARDTSEAQSDVTRLEQLFRSRTTTEVELNRARAELNDAQLALRDAALKLRRRTIVAPISGIVGFVSVEPGNYINAQSELLTIDDRSSLIVEFWVPERFANLVSIGQTVNAVALADPATQYEGTLNGIGSRIEQNSRTLPVEAVIDNSNDRLRPGMSFEILLEFPGQSFPSVDPLAIQWDSEGSFVWKIVDGKVQRMPARIIQRNPESVLVDAELAPGDRVVSEGLLSLRSGASVRVQGAADSENGTTNTGSNGKPSAAANARAESGATGS